MQYKEILSTSADFVALDISVRSTGWVKYKNKQLSFGTYKLVAQEDRKRRQEFREFILQLFADDNFDFVAIEDVIFGNNFETTKSLMQLNIVVEDLMDFGKLATIPGYRIGNTVWKKQLYQLYITKQ